MAQLTRNARQILDLIADHMRAIRLHSGEIKQAARANPELVIEAANDIDTRLNDILDILRDRLTPLLERRAGPDADPDLADQIQIIRSEVATLRELIDKHGRQGDTPPAEPS